MSNEAFLAAIRHAPKDDVLRLVYADWLEEHGDPQRAEFIRLQIEQAQRGEPFPYWSEQAAREEELLADHEAQWRAELPVLDGITWGAQRGFVAWAHIEDSAAFERHAETLRTRTAIRGVSLQYGVGLEQFLSSPQVEPLTALELGYGSGIQPAQSLANCTRLKNLQRLDLCDIRIGDEGVMLLASSAHLAHLTTLDLRSNNLRTTATRDLRESSYLTRLQALDLGGIDPYHGGDNMIGTEGARNLARSENLRHLRSLQLDWNELGDDAARELAQATQLTELRNLDLWANNIGPEGVQALASSTAFPSLTRLELQANPIGPKGAAALACATGLPQLNTLTLWHCQLGDEGVAALAGSPRLGAIQSLDLGNNDITLEGVQTLCNSPHLGELRGLGLRSNPLDGKALTALARSPHLRNLVVLELGEIKGPVPGKMVAELAWSATLPNLRGLGLSASPPEAIVELARSPLAQRLTHLSLSCAKIGEWAARLLLDRSNWPRLSYLGLYGAEMRPETKAALQQRWGQRLNTKHWRWLVG